jgi:hypothetical protein
MDEILAAAWPVILIIVICNMIQNGGKLKL